MPHQFLENISHFHKFCDWPDYEIMVLPICLDKTFEHKNVNIILSISYNICFGWEIRFFLNDNDNEFIALTHPQWMVMADI